jgi:hypothetical protein
MDFSSISHYLQGLLMDAKELEQFTIVLEQQLDKIISLSNKEIANYDPQPDNPDDSLEFLCHKLLKIQVKEIALKRKILKVISHNQNGK